MIEQNESNGIEKIYTYDALDNRKSFVLKQNGTTKTNQSYDYDNMNRLTEVLDGTTIQAKYTYDANGNRATLTYPTSGLTTTYAYNLANLVETLTNKKGSNIVSGFTYAYNLDGNQASKTDTTGRVTNYQYDGLGRLTEESETADGETLTKTYEYDAAGNRETMTVSGTENYTTAYDYDLNNRLKTEVKDKGLQVETAEYQYDKNGNQISKTSFTTGNSGGAEEVGIYALGAKLPMPREDYTVELNEYNVFNQLVKVQNDEGTSIYAYKSDGLRLSKNVNSALTTHIWDGSNIVLEYGAVNDVYLRGINLIKSEEQGYYLYNAHGDVVQRTNSSGTLIKSYVYDAFGNDTRTTNSGGMGSTGSVIDDGDTNPFRYAGEYTDFETGSVYLRNRYYNPSVGGFMSEDPARADLNWYTYCGGNPNSFVDPSGLDAIWINGSDMTLWGHSSLMVEYENEWYYFFYATDMAVLHKIRPAEIRDVAGNDESIPDAMQDLESLNKYLHKVSPHDLNSDYNSATYIQGDFSKTYKFLSELPHITDSRGFQNSEYTILNNCAAKSWEALKLGYLNDGTNVGDYMENFNNQYIRMSEGPISPNDSTAFIQSMFVNKSYVKDEAVKQINSRIDELSNNSAFVRWLLGSDKFITLYKKLL